MAIGWCVLIISGAKQGRLSDTVLFGRIENLGIGKELGGGEFEYVGPAQSSENENLSLAISSLKALSFLQAFALILMGALFTVVFECVLLSECVGDGVLGKGEEGEEKHGLVTGVEQVFNGVGSIPAPDW